MKRREDVYNPIYADVWTVPNGITMMRLIVGIFAALHSAGIVNIVTPLTFGSFIKPDGFIIKWTQQHHFVVGGIILGICIAADSLDGYVARKWDAVSRFGEILDPFVDKVLFWVAVLVLAQTPLGRNIGGISEILFLLPLGFVLVYDVWSLTNHIKNPGGAVSGGKIKSFFLNIFLLSAFIAVILPQTGAYMEDISTLSFIAWASLIPAILFGVDSLQERLL